MTDNDNLPATLTLQIPALPDSSDLPKNVALSTLQEKDFEIAQFELKVISEAFNHIDSIPALLRLLKETRETVKFRRDVLGLPYGHTGKSAGAFDLTPLD